MKGHSKIFSTGILVLLLTLTSGGFLRGQTLLEGMEALEQAERHNRALLKQLFSGEVTASPDNQAHQEAAAVAAKGAIYRFTWKTTVQKTPGEVQDVFRKYIEDHLRNLGKGGDRTKSFARMYALELIKRALEVIHHEADPTAQVNSAPIAKMNVTRVLALSAELGQPELADTLADLIHDPKADDGVRYYAFRGLRTLLSLPPQDPPLLSMEQLNKVADSLVQFLEEKRTFSGSDPDSDSLMAGYQVLRREAVAALAQIHTPTQGSKTPVALVLLRFVGNDMSLEPPPRIDERMEAAIGLARMQPSKDDGYQADYAAYHLGRTVATFGNQAHNDKLRSAAPSDPMKPRRKQLRPWKIDAFRMIQAFEAMSRATKDEYAKQALGQSLRVLTQVKDGSTINAANLNDWLTNNQPPNQTLFQGQADSVVKPHPEGPGL
jgi:hypothetical protein